MQEKYIAPHKHIQDFFTKEGLFNGLLLRPSKDLYSFTSNAQSNNEKAVNEDALEKLILMAIERDRFVFIANISEIEKLLSAPKAHALAILDALCITTNIEVYANDDEVVISFLGFGLTNDQ
ncbi:hypothetical protein AB4235_05575 [Vibrio cyclitrophicus]